MFQFLLYDIAEISAVQDVRIAAGGWTGLDRCSGDLQRYLKVDMMI
jgi:hypothetical protein